MLQRFVLTLPTYTDKIFGSRQSGLHKFDGLFQFDNRTTFHQAREDILESTNSNYWDRVIESPIHQIILPPCRLMCDVC